MVDSSVLLEQFCIFVLQLTEVSHDAIRVLDGYECNPLGGRWIGASRR
jgi:hypothetical protein